MKRHKFTKWNKEKISIYASAALVVCVCVVSGIYAQSQSPSKKQIIDIESVEEKDELGANSIPDAELAAGQEQTEESLPVTNNGNNTIPGVDETAKADESVVLQETVPVDESLSADLTGDAEMAETEVVKLEEEEPSVPTMANNQKSQASVLHFNVEDGMSWPVVGNVVMNYSMDERIYFATLNEYCYYPAVAISAEEGAPVSAAAAGKVSKIGINEEIGQYVVVDLGDGYQATYGQLKDLTIEQGDKISRSQIIGYVAAPTKYYSLEGTNVYFELEQNGTSLNPVTYFK